MEGKLSRVNVSGKKKIKVEEHWQGVLTHTITVLWCLFKHCAAFHRTSVGQAVAVFGG